MCIVFRNMAAQGNIQRFVHGQLISLHFYQLALVHCGRAAPLNCVFMFCFRPSPTGAPFFRSAGNRTTDARTLTPPPAPPSGGTA